MIILGIDPGLATTGYGVIQTGQNDKMIFITHGCITTPAGGDLSGRLKTIYRDLMVIIKDHKPHEIAIEELFFCRNAKTALSVGQSRGVIMLAAANSNKRIFQYTPLQVKQLVTGHGMSEKKIIQEEVKKMLSLKEIPKPDDAADALAIAISHAFASRDGNKRKG